MPPKLDPYIFWKRTSSSARICMVPSFGNLYGHGAVPGDKVFQSLVENLTLEFRRLPLLPSAGAPAPRSPTVIPNFRQPPAFQSAIPFATAYIPNHPVPAIRTSLGGRRLALVGQPTALLSLSNNTHSRTSVRWRGCSQCGTRLVRNPLGC